MDPNEKELDYSSIFDDEMTDGAAEMSAPEETGEAPEENTGEGAETAETQTETPEMPEGAEEPETQRQAEHAEAGRPEAKRQQTPEENARYAAARRDAERQRDEAIAAERRSVSELFAQMGIINQKVNIGGQFDRFVNFPKLRSRSFIKSRDHHMVMPFRYSRIDSLLNIFTVRG